MLLLADVSSGLTRHISGNGKFEIEKHIQSLNINKADDFE